MTGSPGPWRATRSFALIAVLPHHPDQDGRLSGPPNVYGREAAFARLRDAAPDRVALYGIENHQGTPVYVHAKVCIIDDLWAATGSDNFNRRSWTHDSELTAAVWDTAARPEARGTPETSGSAWPASTSTTRTRAVDRWTRCSRPSRRRPEPSRRWHDGGRRGPRPPGRLRPLDDQQIPSRSRWWAEPLYRTVYDPDARPLRARIRGSY